MRYNNCIIFKEAIQMNVLNQFIELILPYMISILELIGIFVVFWSGIRGFWNYLKRAFLKKKVELQMNLKKGLAMGLEFKMAAEILRTVLVQSMDELYMLGAVILLRALLSLWLHFEIIRLQKRGVYEDERKENTVNSNEARE